MKHKYKLLLGLLVLPLISSLFLVNCKKPNRGTQLAFTANVIKYPITVQFYDPADAAKAINITMSISGTNAGDVYEISGSQIFKVTGGTISIGIGPSAAPTVGSPLSFNIEASAPGYLPVKMPVDVTASDSSQVIKIAMVNTTTPPDGVTGIKTTKPLTGDSVATPITVVTPVSGTSTEYSSVTIPAGTTFKDANGTQLSGSNLNITMLHFAGDNATALSTFPGGSVASNNIVGGPASSGIFQPAGFIDLGMTVGAGTSALAVKTFNKPVDVSMSIDPTHIETATGTPYTVGETLSIYSYQVETGIWTFEEDITLVAGTGGVLMANFSTTHLTKFVCAKLGTACPDEFTNFTINQAIGAGYPAKLNYYMEIYQEGTTTNPILAKYVTVNANSVNGAQTASTTISIKNVPLGNVDVYIYKNDQRGFVYGTLPHTSLCGGAQINLIAGALGTPITFDLYGYCTDSNKVVRPDGVGVYYRATGSTGAYSYLGTISRGTFVTYDLTYQQTYDFHVSYDGQTYNKTRIVDSMSYNGEVRIPVRLEANLCK